MKSVSKKFAKSTYFQLVSAAVLMTGIVMGFWYGSQIALGTSIPPVIVITGGSMCISCEGACDGWAHPFDRTLHVGDIIIIQGVNPQDLNADYPNSDIIVFHNPKDPNELEIRRIAKVNVD